MIFVAFGNSPCPFPRVAAAIEKLAGDTGEEIIAQSGCTDFEFKHVKAVPFMSQDVFKRHLSSCEIAVLQGGWGGGRSLLFGVPHSGCAPYKRH